jgi:hypothetical protein
MSQSICYQCGGQCDIEQEKLLGDATFCSDICIDRYLIKCEEKTGVSVRSPNE